MKNTFKTLTIALLSIFAFTGCEDDKGSNYETPNYLVGTWEYKQVGTIGNNGVVQYDNVAACNEADFTNIGFAPNYTYVSNAFNPEDNCSLTTETGNYGIINGDIILTDNANNETRFDVGLFTDKELDLITSDENGALTFYKLFKK